MVGRSRRAGVTPMADMDAIAAFLRNEFPHCGCRVLAVGEQTATVARPIDATALRPGGSVAGPVLMGVADVALYVAVLGAIGIVPLALTTSLTMNFLRPAAGDRELTGVARLLKRGRRLVVGEVSVYSHGDTAPVAHAVGTYAIPPGADATA